MLVARQQGLPPVVASGVTIEGGGIRQALEFTPGQHLVGQAQAGNELVDGVQQGTADVVGIDLVTGEQQGGGPAWRGRGQSPRPRIPRHEGVQVALLSREVTRRSLIISGM